MNSVPFVDLRPQHSVIAAEVASGWERVLARLSFVLGEELSLFETEYAMFSDVKHCVGVANGGDALEIALRALDISEGDEVVVPANSYTATAMSVLRVGAIPIFCDVDDQFLLMNPASLAEAIGPKTRAVIPVHLFGQLAPMREIMKIAEAHDLKVIEDGAQSHGAKQDGLQAGNFGNLVATSFYPGKNLGAYGDGGALLTNGDVVAERLKRIRNYGGLEKYDHEEFGLNSRLDEIQAVVLRAKLKHLAVWNEQRADVAQTYSDLLSENEKIQLPAIAPGNTHVWHLFVARLNNRDDVINELKRSNIGFGMHYPTPIHRQKAFAGFEKPRVSLATTENAANEILSLPIYPGLLNSTIQIVVAAILRAVR